ncbi:MAG: PD-(D/E)XK nuclease family protein [Ruminococcus sp.]|nr:PD-(D/E)XK nuclease family protein [Ruminococcus sp.]
MRIPASAWNPSRISHAPGESHSISFNGKVDRIDDFVSPDGTRYIRVVDYKTGSKKFSLDDVANGLNIQMLLYMFEATELPEFKGSRYAGVLYALVHTPNSIEDREPDKTQIESALNDALRMDGLLLRDEDNTVIYAMEPAIRTAYESGTKFTGRFIPISVKATRTSVTIDDKHTADDSTFGQIKDMIYTQLEDMCRNIYDGLIPASPLESDDSRYTACDMCDYADLCMNRTVEERKRRTFDKEDNDG